MTRYRVRFYTEAKPGNCCFREVYCSLYTHSQRTATSGGQGKGREAGPFHLKMQVFYLCNCVFTHIILANSYKLSKNAIICPIFITRKIRFQQITVTDVLISRHTPPYVLLHLISEFVRVPTDKSRTK